MEFCGKKSLYGQGTKLHTLREKIQYFYQNIKIYQTKAIKRELKCNP